MEPVNKRNYDTQQRRALAEQGKALPDGSFPIVDRADLANALQAIGRAANRQLAEQHIRRRAKALDAMDMLPDWAMAKAKVTPLTNALSTLLADSYSVYHDAHGFHWNVKGTDFAQYHELFAEISDDIYGSIDDIAENILKIEGDAPFRMSQLAQMRTVPEGSPDNTPQDMATELLREINGLLVTLKRTFDVATQENEQGIADFIAGRIDMTQKWAWQLRSSVGVQKTVISMADKMVLKAMHDSALEVMTLPEWIGVIKEVAKAGGIRNLDGYALVALEKAKQSFGGDRSAAGRYAAQQRWSKRTGVSDGAVATKNPAGAGEAMNMEMIGKTHDEAISAVGASTPTGKKLVEAKTKLDESRKADVTGDAFGAWEKASQAAFDVEQLAGQRGASSIVKRLSGMLQRLVSDLTDAFYAEQAA